VNLDAALAEVVVEAIAPLVQQVAELTAAVQALRAPAAQEPALLSVAEAARLCGVSSCTLRRWERDGAVQSVRRAHTVRIVASSLKPASADDIARAARAARAGT
jgi:DNA-binding transcriptional regulator YiaG